MIQDIQPHKLINSFTAGQHPSDNDPVIVYLNDSILFSRDEIPQFPLAGSSSSAQRDALVYLFTVDDDRFFLLAEEIGPLHGYEFIKCSGTRKGLGMPQHHVFALMTAIHLARWYHGHRYCGTCGKMMLHDDRERALYCPVCGKKEYPRINPAVIVGVINGDKLLLTRYRRGFSQNALVAGFTEIGETLEQTVEREVMEEAGLKVRNIRYYKSQPWGIAADILAGFYCDVDGSDAITMDESELKEARWTAREDIVLQDNSYSLTNEMMRRFKEGKEC